FGRSATLPCRHCTAGRLPLSTGTPSPPASSTRVRESAPPPRGNASVDHSRRPRREAASGGTGRGAARSTAGAGMDGRRVAHIAILGAVPFIMVLGNSMLIPVFPQLQQAMELTQFQVGLLITLFSAPAALVIPFAGIISDHIGRRPVIALALLVYGAGGLIAGGAAVLLRDPYAVILLGRVVQGIGAGGTYLLAVALAGDLFQGAGRTRVLGILEAANGAGKVASPILGAAVALAAWWAPFFVYGVLAIPAALLVWFFVEEPAVPEARGLAEYARALGRIFRRRGVPLAAAYLAGMAVLFLLFGVLSFVSDELGPRYGIRGFAGGLVLAIPVAAMAAMAYGAG